MSCPICEKPTDPTYRPFCSKRCADVDLGKWFNGSYAIPSTDPDDAEEVIEALEDEQRARSRPH
ncbi:DNA gyrase inhibitor YacG [Jannaschia marina]|uniref:DNA gyrase inhibitor YacG n=1 Tax=Jannaschia marina TaxID=2741674 RepID=UPI0015CB2DC2|nr:DNA gyrase inhibitor YacG [Jannaschia marina]